MNLKGVFIFLLGAGVGAGSMYLVLNKKFVTKFETKLEEKVNEELDKIKKNKEPAKEPEVKVQETVPEEKKEEPDLSAYKKVLEKVDYSKVPVSEPVKSMTDVVNDELDKISETVTKKSSKKTKVPKKVTQDEFDSTAVDERETLYFYADGILADASDNIYDPTETMGATNFKQFNLSFHRMKCRKDT